MNTDVQTPAAEAVGLPPEAPRAQPMAVRDRRASQQLERVNETGRSVDTSPPAVIARALAQGTPIADLKELMAMQERWEAAEAKKAYAAAMAAFKANPPTIEKDKRVNYKLKEGGKVDYRHATIGNVVNKIVAGLAQHGLSHRWTVEQQQGAITVTCIVTHERGHSETVTLTGGKDDSGKKNAIQQVASTITYLQRYTLLAATGLATMDQPDNDGKDADEPVDTIDAEQLKTLQGLITELVPTSVPDEKFQDACVAIEKQMLEAMEPTWGAIEVLDDLPAKAFQDAVERIKRRKANAKLRGAK